MAKREVSLRPVVAEDWEFWRKLHHVAERATIERQFGWDEALQDNFARTTFEDDEGERAVIVVDGKDAGWWQVKPREGELFLNQLIVHPDYQGQGIGGGLLDGLMVRAKAEGRRVKLQTLLENTAKGMYEKRGFKVVGVVHTHWVMEWVPH